MCLLRLMTPLEDSWNYTILKVLTLRRGDKTHAKEKLIIDSLKNTNERYK